MTGRVAGVLVLVTMIVAGCSVKTPGTASHSQTPSHTPSKISWADCGSGFQCGTLQVPLDYAHPEGRTIALAVIRKPATAGASRIGSLLVNPGGPGESGIQFLRSDTQSLADLNHSFDLVAWDPRGVAQSTPVSCVDGPHLDAYLALDSVLDDPQEKQAAIQADKDYAAGCQSHSGELLPFMDTASTARDVDQIRIAVGDAKLTYLGLSYGTYIGQWYAHLFPTKVRALSLDGVVDPTVSANDSLLGQVVGFEQNLKAFLADCKSRSSCLYGRSGDPGTKLAAAMARLDATPLKVGARELTRSLAMTGVLVTLYSQSFWQYLDQGLTALDGGDGRILLILADEYNQRHSDGTYDNLFNGAYAATYCLDFPVPTDIAAYDALGPTYTKASALFGPWSQYSNMQCAFWPVKPTNTIGPLTVSGAPPILLVGGTNDPATPYSEAQSVNRQIEGSVLLTRQGNGHTSYDSSSCAHAAEDSYLISLKLPSAGAVCSS
ncbi:MAG TPA: alpha/beta hydrolase [Candidatus Limnocylindrales bacterium]|nr:alpha/beta hydrolase [Candidatus Limnocylindrales bacterium]